ncbi:unnamed protein product [Owenia fusiformis]|uniref:Uncharacterized protein n=1 Tax=Owenia fusiformis TaxID=6347 RepID=A0A8S4P669_OWEFU|nr:unnamed protein product [Owenia fusiformis]
MSGKLKQNLKRGDYLDEDDFDTLSMRSDMSDEDDDNLMMLMNDGEMPAFERKGSFGDSETTEGSDLKDAETSSVNTISSDKARNVVSVVLFKIHNLEAVVQAVNLNTIAKLGIDHLSPEEFGNVELERFQAKFLAGSKDHCDLPILETAPVNLRFSMGPDAELLAPTAGERGFIHVQANDLDLNLNMSSVTSLTDLIEDEKLADAVPMLVELIQTAVHLKEDKPPTNITSPGAIPLDFNVSKAVIRRTQDGAFHLLGDTHTIPATRKDLSFEDRLSDGDVTVATLKRSPSREDTFSGFEETLTRQNSATESSLSQLTSQNEQLTNQLASSKVIQQSIERENELLRKRLCEAESECVEQSSNSLNEEWGIVTEQDVISAKNLDTADKNIEKIISENTELKKMLEKFTQLDQIKRLKELQGENAQLKEQLKDYAKLSDERDKLLVEVTTSHSDADAWKQERESLMQTLRLLQEELIASEKMRFPNS